MIEQLIQQYGDASFLIEIGQCLGYIPVGLLLGVIAWAIGYAVNVFLRTVRSSV